MEKLSEMYGLSHEALQAKLGINKEIFGNMYKTYADKRMPMSSSIVQKIKTVFPEIGDDFFMATQEEDAQVILAREKVQAEKAMKAEQLNAQVSASSEKKSDAAAPAPTEPAKKEASAEKTEEPKKEVKKEKPAEPVKEEDKAVLAPVEAKEEPVKEDIKKESKEEKKAEPKAEAKKDAKAAKKSAAPAKAAEKKPSSPKPKKEKPFYKMSCEVVAALLEREKCTMEELAKKIGMSIKQLSNYTKGAIGKNRNFAMLRERCDATLKLPEEFYLADPAEVAKSVPAKKPAAKKETAKAEPKKTEKPAEATKAEPKKADKPAEPVKPEPEKTESAAIPVIQTVKTGSEVTMFPVHDDKELVQTLKDSLDSEEPAKEEKPAEPVKAETKAKPVKAEKPAASAKKEPEKKAPVLQAPAKASSKRRSSSNNKVKLKPAHVVIENILAMGYTKAQLGEKIGKDERYIKRWLAGALSNNTTYDGLKEMLDKALKLPEEFYLPGDTPVAATEPAKTEPAKAEPVKEEKKESEKATATAPAKAASKKDAKKPAQAVPLTPLAKVADAIKKIDDNHGAVKFKGDINEVKPEDVTDWADRFEEHLKERTESQYDKKLEESIKNIDEIKALLEQNYSESKKLLSQLTTAVANGRDAIRDNAVYNGKTKNKITGAFDVLRETVKLGTQDAAAPAEPEGPKDECVKVVEDNSNEKFRKLVLLASKLDEKDIDRLISVAENKSVKSGQIIDKALTLKGKELDTVLAVADRGKMEDKFMQSIELTAKLNSDEKFDVILPVLKMTASK